MSAQATYLALQRSLQDDYSDKQEVAARLYEVDVGGCDAGVPTSIVQRFMGLPIRSDEATDGMAVYGSIVTDTYLLRVPHALVFRPSFYADERDVFVGSPTGGLYLSGPLVASMAFCDTAVPTLEAAYEATGRGAPLSRLHRIWATARRTAGRGNARVRSDLVASLTTDEAGTLVLGDYEDDGVLCLVPFVMGKTPMHWVTRLACLLLARELASCPLSRAVVRAALDMTLRVFGVQEQGRRAVSILLRNVRSGAWDRVDRAVRRAHAKQRRGATSPTAPSRYACPATRWAAALDAAVAPCCSGPTP